MKICSLLPSATEILFALTLGDQVVGVTDNCDYPPEAKTRRVVSRSLIDPAPLSSAEVERRMQEILKDGGAPFVLDTEWIRKEKRDLVVTQDLCSICDVDAGEVMQASRLLPVPPEVLILSPRRLSDIFADVKKVGEAAAASARAEGLINTLRARVDAVARTAATAPRRPRVLSLEGIDPLAAGGGWLPEIKVLAGGRDELFSPGCPARRFGWETVADYAPEVLVIALCSSAVSRSLKELGWLARQEGWWELPAVRTGQVYVIDHVYYSRPGPRIVEGLEILAQILHPELFAGLVPPDTIVKMDPVAARGCPPEQIASSFHPYPEESVWGAS